MSERTRPAVTVVVPFKGDEGAARRLLRVLEAIIVGDGDELIAVDNTRGGTLEALAGERRVRVIHATAEASSYYARNVGAEKAVTDWILFTDADCLPRPTILDDYFTRDIDDRCGALGGEVVGASGKKNAVARYAAARGYLNQEGHLASSVRPFVGAANMLVRRDAWLDVGGFCEGIRTGGDQDFSWRLQDRGWTIAYAGEAIVEHIHREHILGLLEQALRYGTAIAWLARRHPNTYEHASVVRGLGGAARMFARAGVDGARRKDEAGFAALDALTAAAFALGPLIDNRARANDFPHRPRTVALIETFGAEADETATQVEARRRHEVPRPWLFRDIVANYGEDDGELRYVVDAVLLGARHPLRFRAAARHGGSSFHSVVSLAPTARRLLRTLRTGASWAADPSRVKDAEVLHQLVGPATAWRGGSVSETTATR